MKTNIHICQLPNYIQVKIENEVTEFLKSQGCYSRDNLENIMEDRFENLNQEGFTEQYNKLKDEIENDKVLNAYNSIITSLQANDKNASYNEILEDVEGDLNEAINLLKACLARIIEDEGMEGKELEFYITQLNRINNINININ